MRKLLTLLLLLNLVISCSEDDAPNEQQAPEFPTNISLSLQTAEIGEILTINGNGFLVNETYIVAFTDNVVGNITEINNSSLKVEIPENAESGNISLTFNNQTVVIGSVEITSAIELYCYKRVLGASSSIHQLIKVNTSTGAQSLISNLEIAPTGYYQDLAYNSEDNSIYGTKSNDEFLKINLTTQESTIINLDNPNGDLDYDELVFDNNGNLYCYKRIQGASSSVHQLIKINTSTGAQSLISNLEIAPTGYYQDLAYNSEDNSIYGIKSNDEFLKFNLTTQESTIINLDNPNGDLDYDELVFDNNGNLYCYKRIQGASSSVHQLIKINTSTGAQSLISNLEIAPTGYYQDLAYNSEDNSIYGIKSNDEFLKFNLTTQETTTISLDNPNDDLDYAELIFED